MSKQASITIPTSLIPELEQWGKLTTKVFGELRRLSQLKPKGISKDQEWYWSKTWQEWERDADKAESRGEYLAFKSAKNAINYLHSKV